MFNKAAVMYDLGLKSTSGGYLCLIVILLWHKQDAVLVRSRLVERSRICVLSVAILGEGNLLSSGRIDQTSSPSRQAQQPRPLG